MTLPAEVEAKLREISDAYADERAETSELWSRIHGAHFDGALAAYAMGVEDRTKEVNTFCDDCRRDGSDLKHVLKWVRQTDLLTSKEPDEDA